MLFAILDVYDCMKCLYINCHSYYYMIFVVTGFVGYVRSMYQSLPTKRSSHTTEYQQHRIW
jgi:hypothetical protein